VLRGSIGWLAECWSARCSGRSADLCLGGRRQAAIWRRTAVCRYARANPRESALAQAGGLRLNRRVQLPPFRPEHLGLPARDPVGMKNWYVRVLDARLVFTNASGEAFFVALAGGLMIEIYGAETARLETADNHLAGWRHLALRVDSIETAQAVLTARGVEFRGPVKPAGGGGRVLFFADPEGNLLHLVERPAGTVFDL
jgi:glyoxylase I family protein